jgi:hypothetical protein
MIGGELRHSGWTRANVQDIDCGKRPSALQRCLHIVTMRRRSWRCAGDEDGVAGAAVTSKAVRILRDGVCGAQGGDEDDQAKGALAAPDYDGQTDSLPEGMQQDTLEVLVGRLAFKSYLLVNMYQYIYIHTHDLLNQFTWVCTMAKYNSRIHQQTGMKLVLLIRE